MMNHLTIPNYLTELKKGNLGSGIQAANRALEVDPKNTKALYRKGKLLEQKGELQDAEKALKLAVQLEPGSQVRNFAGFFFVWQFPALL